MNLLDNIYDLSIAELPSIGRYTVYMKIRGSWQIVLEKTINVLLEGQNHLPLILFRHFNMSFMNFSVEIDKVHKETIFKYNNGLIIDKLRKRKDKNEWIGKIFYRDKFIDYFILKEK